MLFCFFASVAVPSSASYKRTSFYTSLQGSPEAFAARIIVTKSPKSAWFSIESLKSSNEAVFLKEKSEG